MWVESIRLYQFRNYAGLTERFGEGLNLIVGENAQGKTNLLEALNVLATGKSHRTNKDTDLILFGAAQAYAGVTVKKAHELTRVELKLGKNEKKQIKINGQAAKTMAEAIGAFFVVMFSPEDLKLVKQGPGERRRFMDTEIAQQDKKYFAALLNYQKALMQRNALLKDIAFNKAGEGELFVWEEQMARYAAAIVPARRRFFAQICGKAEEIHKEMCKSEALYVSYECDVEENLNELLRAARKEDIRRGMTLRGPHRDDFALKINGQDLRIFGSQGQQRTAALALKLSEVHLLEELCGEPPILLLDDVLSELDEMRQKSLVKTMRRCQTFLTCAIKPDIYGDVYMVKDGKIFKKE